MPLHIPNSIEDFRQLREQKFEYIDKSQLISEFIDRDGFRVVLVPRPRRFGKSLNLTMLRWLFGENPLIPTSIRVAWRRSFCQ